MKFTPRTAARVGLCIGALWLASAAWAQPAPPPPRDPENIESMFSFSAYYWKPSSGMPAYRGGALNIDPSIRTFDFPKGQPRSIGATLTFPTGGFNRMEIAYFQVKGDGSVRPPLAASIEGQDIKAGELVATRYKLTNVRVAWNYLTFPVPPLDSRFRVKTFWEFQYMKIKPELRFPETDATRLLAPDRVIAYPGVGLGLEYVASRAFRLEARGSGMALPGRARYLDSEASGVVRIGSIEVFGGAKFYHFTSSRKQETYIKGTLWGPYGGIRYVFPK